MTLTNRRIAIIGAGISGLACGRELQQHGAAVTVFEKSRTIGGRCASRLWEGHVVDHGAQYFTIRDDGFREVLKECCQGVIRTLEAPVLPWGGEVMPGNEPRWYHVEGNNHLGRALLGDLSLRLDVLVDTVETDDAGVVVAGERFDAVVSSAPWPQTALLLGDISMVGGSYVSCLTVFCSYQGSWVGRSREAYARVNRREALAWSACENHKLGRVHGEQTVFVVQASGEFSLQYLEEDPALWLPDLQTRLEEVWELPKAQRLATLVHRWRFARCIEPVRLWKLPPGFFVTGDVCTTSRVESAWLAGRTTARQVLGWFG